jgi:hypothetical protein
LKAIFGRGRYANVTSTLALVIALGGTSYAAITLPRNSVGNKQIRSDAVTSGKVKNRSLLARDFKRGQLPAGPRGLKGDPGAPGTPGAPGAPGANALVKLTTLAPNFAGSTTNTSTYQRVATIGTFTKLQAASTIRLVWNGEIEFSGTGTTYCKLELRIDDKDATGASGASTPLNAPGQALIHAPTTADTASVTVHFSGLAVGTHEVSLWIRNVNGSSCGTGGSNSPAQNVYVEELAVS